MATRVTQEGDPVPRVISLRLKKGEAERLGKIQTLRRLTLVLDSGSLIALERNDREMWGRLNLARLTPFLLCKHDCSLTE